MAIEIDYTEARNRMVDSQIRPVRVSDPSVIDAMRSLPRELFLPPRLRPTAYADTVLELGAGRAMLEPRVLARLMQIAQPRPGERACVVGAGTGYGAALLSRLGPVVTALEEDPALLAIARDATARAGCVVDFREGLLADGLPGEDAFDLVFLDGGAELLPPAIETLVAARGRLVFVQLAPGSTQMGQGVIAENAGGKLRSRAHFDGAARVLPGFARPAGFQF